MASLQTSAAGHFLPHPPQLAASVRMLTQAGGEPHSACTVGSGFAPHITHAPPMQLAAVPQAVPHTPQSSELLLRSTHVAFAPLPQTFRPTGQTHPLLTHVAPVAHVCPHSPQFSGSVAVYTHIKRAPASALSVGLGVGVGPASSVSGLVAASMPGGLLPASGVGL